MKPLVIAHRGASEYAQENTKEAIDIAYKMGADGVEIDIRRTKDGEIVCFHDKDLSRFGVYKTVEELSLKEIENLQGKVKIETIKDLIPNIEKFKIILFDIKGEGIAPYLLDLLDNSILERAVFITGYLNVLSEIHKLNVQKGFWFYKPIDYISLANQYNLDYIKPNYRVCSDMLIEEVHKIKKKVFVWTVDDPNLARKLASKGVDGIVTDVPDVIINNLNNVTSS